MGSSVRTHTIGSARRASRSLASLSALIFSSACLWARCASHIFSCSGVWPSTVVSNMTHAVTSTTAASRGEDVRLMLWARDITVIVGDTMVVAAHNLAVPRQSPVLDRPQAFGMGFDAAPGEVVGVPGHEQQCSARLRLA